MTLPLLVLVASAAASSKKAAPPPEPPPPWKLLEAAYALETTAFADHRPESAEAAAVAFAQAFAGGADPAAVWLELGHLSQAGARYTDAERCYRRAAADPSGTEAAMRARAELAAMGAPASGTADASRDVDCTAGALLPSAGDTLGAVPAALTGTDDETAHLARGYAALAAGKRTSALGELRAAAAAAKAPASPVAVEGRAAGGWVEAAWQAKAQGDTDAARAALDAALLLGAEPQAILLERAWLELGAEDTAAGVRDLLRVVAVAKEIAAGTPGDAAAVRASADRADKATAQLRAMGLPEDLAAPAQGGLAGIAAERATGWLANGYAALAQGHDDEAIAAFRQAARAGLGAAPSVHELRDVAAAAKAVPALPAPAPEAAGAASAEVATATVADATPKFRGEAYEEAYGWHRLGPTASDDLVPTVLVRAFWKPLASVPVEPYLYAIGSRDLASRGEGPAGYPLIYADNTAGLGAGALFRAWGGRIGVFAQLGPALNLLDDGRQRVWLDARVGALADVYMEPCKPGAVDGIAHPLTLCGESYGEVVFASRFDDNVLAQVRGRGALNALLTGPVAWQPYVEARAYKDLNDDFWNNKAEAGIGVRWRLSRPFDLDVLAGYSIGTYYGLENVDRAPVFLGYQDLRLLAQSGLYF